MAVLKIWTVKGQLSHPIDYAKNPEKTLNPKYAKSSAESLEDVMDYAVNEEKTEKKYFVSGVNCNPETARSQFTTVKKQFDKEDGIIAYHGYQSFAEGEVTPDQAHAVGMEFAKKVWGKEYQVIVATHLNTKCLHNHFVVNSVSFVHGKRCRTKQWRNLSKISDEICRQHQLSVIENPMGKGMPYPMIKSEQRGESTRLTIVRKAVNQAINQSANMYEFTAILKEQGYTCQFRSDRKYWTIRQKDWKRPMRLSRLGEDYTNTRIEERVRENPTSVRMNQYQQRGMKRQYLLPTRLMRIKKVGGLKGLYLHYCYELGYLPKYMNHPTKVSYHLRDDLSKLNQISEETKLLCRENISTVEQLLSFQDSLERLIEEISKEREVQRNIARRVTITPQEVVKAKEEIQELSERLDYVRREVRLCDGIKKRVPTLEENLTKVQEEEKQKEDRRKER